MNNSLDGYLLDGCFLPYTDPDSIGTRRIQAEGLFETLTYWEDRVIHGSAHLERLTQSAETLGIPLPSRVKALEVDSRALAQRMKLEKAALRWTLFLSSSKEVSLLIQCMPLPSNLASRRTGIHGITQTLSRSLPHHKSLDYASVEEAQKKAETIGASPAEAILCSPSGDILEGSRSNIFITKDNVIYTPPTSRGILPGVTRAEMMNYLITAGVSCVERDLSLKDITEADGVCLTNSLVGCAPLVTLDGRRLKTRFHKMMASFWSAQLSIN
jgi:branched-chain amino acid aminotransferase